jgi:phage gp36-like protein
VKTAAMDIARYYLYDARAPEIVKDRYKSSVAWLKDVANGVAS